MSLRATVAILDASAAAPSPPANRGALYVKSADSHTYWRNAAGTEYRISGNEVVDSGWIAATLAGTWTNFGSGWHTAAYRKIDGVVYLRGLVTGGTGTILTLPAGYRPAATLMFPVVVQTWTATTELTSGGVTAHTHTMTRNNVGSRSDVTAAGAVSVGTVPGFAGYASLNNIVFPAEA